MAAQKRKTSKKPVDAEKLAAKKARREARQAEEAAAKKAAARKKKLRSYALVTALVVAAGVVMWALWGALFPGEVDGVETFASNGREHVTLGTPVDYPTATPTSGTHASQSANCGIYTEQIPLELAVHGLEHGAIVIWYRPDVGDDVIDELTDLVREYDSHVILSPNPDIAEPVVATAWTRRKAYDGADTEIREFIDVYARRGPERVPCDF